MERLQRKTDDGLTIEPLYRESSFPSATDPRGAPGEAPYLRGASAEPDPFLPWDIRQSFGHPDPEVTNKEILRDLERGVSSIELCVDCTGKSGVAIHDADTLATALNGVRADIASVALDHCGMGSGTSLAGLLALWGEQQGGKLPEALRFARVPLISHDVCEPLVAQFSSAPLTETMLCAGRLEGGPDACSGDSGGPLFVWPEELARPILIGVVSWGYGCGQPNSPGVYARVSVFSEWISSSLALPPPGPLSRLKCSHRGDMRQQPAPSALVRSSSRRRRRPSRSRKRWSLEFAIASPSVKVVRSRVKVSPL